MKSIVFTLLICLSLTAPVAAQPDPLVIRVVDASGLAIAGSTVTVRSDVAADRLSAVTDDGGEARIDLGAGTHTLTAVAPGFSRKDVSVTLPTDASVTVTLAIAGLVQEVTVRASMPELALSQEIEGTRIEERVSQDSGEFLRSQPEMFSARRGPINMDPTLRGLQETEVGMFVDGTRTFSAGPARMDSELSHVSPHAVQSVRVVKGPYALTWGAGAMSAIQLETIRPEFGQSSFDFSGRAGYNFGANGKTSDGYVTTWGSDDKIRFMASHNTRVGNDYEDGEGNEVAASYKSYDTRWDFGVLASENATIEYSGGYQEQRDIDFPGRILDATFFKTQSHTVELDWNRTDSSQIYVQFFANLKEHRMNNDEKPTAMAMPGRKPPFGLDIDLPATSDTVGARAFMAGGSGDLSWKGGFDFYDLNQNAERTVSRRSNGMTLFHDIVWPDATIRDLGGYGQLIYSRGRGQIGGTVRVDGVDASAGEVSTFFSENTTGDLDQTETNVSAAVNATFRASNRVVLSAGLGRVVRTAGTLERYSDRFPAVKFQNAAEFMGNPELAPEQSLEWNVGASIVSGRSQFGLDAFGRNMNDYITVMLDPDLPKRLPLSPDTVYRYVNGQAQFYGYEAFGSTSVGSNFDLRGSLSYVWAQDETFDEPAFGIAPLKFIVTGRVKTGDERYWGELELTTAAEQNRVAAARLEKPTDGWARLDLRAGFSLGHGIGIRAGFLNVTNAQYATHLNALNPFTRTRVAEPGRSIYVGVACGF